MPKQNPYLIENKKPIELVQELKDEYKTPSYEEFAETYETDEKIIDSYNFEVASYGNIEVGKRSGPMPFGDEALTIARSDAIMSRIRSEFPKVAELLDWKREATLGFLKKNHALSGYRLVSHDFTYSFSDSETKSGPGAWSKFLREVKVYVEKIHRENLGNRLFGELDAAREVLSEYIHEEYRRILPFWPDIGETKTESFKASISGSYAYGSSSQIVWDCLGWINVRDERPYRFTYKAYFSGSPEIKALVLNVDKMKEIEEDCTTNMWRMKEIISGRENSYRQIDWDVKYL